jgi:NADP-dependent 3-hydroxy acid dehydrogenase YdfG
MFNYLKPNKNFIVDDSSNVIEFIPPLSYPDIYNKLNAEFKKGGSFSTITNSFYSFQNENNASFGTISDECRYYMQNILSPSEEINKKIELVFSSVYNINSVNNFKIIHLRFGDKYLYNNIFDENLYNSSFNKISEYLSPNYKLFAVINNAAEQLLNKTEELSYQDWQQTLNVNLTAPFLLIQGLLRELIAGQGSVINIGSIHQKLTKPRFVAYATSKAGLVGLTQSLAVDLAGKIRVNCISPAAVETPMLQAGFSNASDYQQLKDIHPVGRIGFATVIAEMVYFLASEKAGFINGANIEIDGGIGHVLKDL